MMCYTKVFHNKHSHSHRTVSCGAVWASLQCTGAEERVGGEASGGRRRGEAEGEEEEEGLRCHRPGLPAHPDGVMGTASCGLNYGAQRRGRLVLFFF